MNSSTILRAHRTCPFAFVGALAVTFVACGNESINVLAPRDAATDTVLGDVSGDASIDDVDVSVDAAGNVDTSVSDRSSMDRSTDLGIPEGPTPDTSPVDGADASTINCLPRDPPQCSIAGACCTLSCPLPGDGGQRRCATGPLCSPAGGACGDNADCCGSLCDRGACVDVPPDRCRPAGESCASNDQCCGGICTELIPGSSTRCKLLDSCRVIGEICAGQGDCCSGRCEINRNVPICVPAPPCGLGGNMCRGQAGDLCTSDSDCCTGACSAPGPGTRRCTASLCGPQCASCTRDSECCMGRCLAENNYFRCVDMPDF